MTCLVGMILLALQQDKTVRVRELIENLRSGTLEQRDEAEGKLEDLGNAAVPELQKITDDLDTEVASRARHILAVVAIRTQLTANLLKVVPGLDHRLARGGDISWADVFDKVDNASGLVQEDLDAFAMLALREAKKPDDKRRLLNAVAGQRHRAAMPGVIRLLEDPDAGVRAGAVEALWRMRAREAIPRLKAALKDRSEIVRRKTVEAFLAMGAKEAAPEIVPMLKDPDASVRWQSAVILGEFGAKEAIPNLTALLDDEDPNGRAGAVYALGLLKSSDAASKIGTLLKDGDASVRRNAALALGRLRTKGSIAGITLLLTDQDSDVRRAAASSLCWLDSRDGVEEALRSADRQDYRPLFSLNVLRQPELCEKLRDKLLTSDLEGTEEEMLQGIAKEAGLPIEFAPGYGRYGPVVEFKMRVLRGSRSLLEAIDSTGGYLQVIIESDRLRVVSRDEGLKFWKEWWATIQKK